MARPRRDTLDVAVIARLVNLACLVLVAVAVVNWTGWAANIGSLTTFLQGWVPMRPWTALWLALLAIAVLLHHGGVSPSRTWLARGLLLFTAVTAAIVLFEYATVRELGIDTWWFHDAVERSPLPLPGRPSEQTVVPVLLLSAAVMILAAERAWLRLLRLYLIAFALFFPAVALVAEFLRSWSFIQFREAVQIAPATALSLVVACFAVIGARPDRPPLSWFMTRPDNASLVRLFVVFGGFPLGIWVSRQLLLELGASRDTALLFAGIFSTVGVGLSVYVVSREEQQLLTERAALVDDLSATTERYRLLAENASDLVFSISTDRTISWMSPSSHTMLGFAPGELIGQPTSFIVFPDDMKIVDEFRPTVVHGAPTVIRVRLMSKQGVPVWSEVSGHPILDAEGQFAGVVASVRNITQEVAAQRAFEHEVAFDGLTGLPRRDVALQRIDEILTERGESGWALICVGVSGMTQINQAYTYTAGDRVLKEVADRLVSVVGVHDRVARIAGDEFAVLLPDLVSTTGAAAAAERIVAAVRGELRVGKNDIEIAASVGIAMADDHDAEELLRDATAAMRQAARKGQNRWEFLDGNIGAQTREVLQIQTELRAALSAGQLEAWFMPVVGLPGRENEGYETLVRWRRDDGSVWAPDLFLEIAERSGIIIELDREMFRQMQMAALRTDEQVPFGYNVSAASLASDSFADWVIAELAASGLNPRRLKFEITETAIFHVTDGIKHTMQRLANLGIDWWVDDFGTGFSSISHLRDLPIAGLKLDKSFTAEITSGKGHAEQLAEGLLGLAHGLQLNAIAEGVETVEQEAVLAAQGWAYAQGWLYGRPAPAHW